MTTTLTRPAFETFEKRCQALRLLTWWCDGDGALVGEPNLPASLQPWLDSPTLRHRIETAARKLLERSDVEDVDPIFPGCTLILNAARRAADAMGVVATMVLSPQFGSTREFEQLCRDGNLDAANTALELSPWMAHESESIDTFRRILRWMHDDLLAMQRHERAIEEFSRTLLQSFEQTHLLFRLARMLNGRNDPDMMMRMTCQQLLTVLPFQWIAAKFGGGEDVLGPLSQRLIVAGTLPCEEAAFDAAAYDMVNSAREDSWTRLLSPGDSAIAALVAAEVIAEPITHDGKPVGLLLAGNKTGSDFEVSSAETQFLEAAGDFLGVFHENMARFDEQRALFLGTLGALTASIDAKDRYTCGHSERVAHLASLIALAMPLPAEQIEQVRISGLVHDVGKIGVPEAVLCKPGQLTDEEFAQIKRHPVIGYNILRDIAPLADVLPGVLYHHERWDGKGYPEGRAGEDIPLFGRIIAVADTYDAMCSTRSYRTALPRETALAELRRCAGKQLDPQLIAIFEALDLCEYDAMVERHRAAAQEQSEPEPRIH